MNEKIEEILKKFNFKKLCIAMNAVGWQYKDKDVTEETLIEKASELLNEAIKNEGCSISSGGFTAFFEKGMLYLEFTFDYAEVEIEENRTCSNCRYSDFGKRNCFRLMDYAEPKIDLSKGVECGMDMVHWRGE